MDKAQLRFCALWERSGFAIYEMDLKGVYIDANEKAREMIGYELEEFKGMSYYAVVLVDEINKTTHHFNLAVQGYPQHYEVNVVKKDGTILTLDVVNFPIIEDGEVISIYGLAKDITPKKRETEKIHQLAFYDAKTALPNEALFLDRTAQAMRLSRKKKQPLHVLCLHIDQLSEKNKTFGYHKDERLLKAVIQRLHWELGPDDTIARGRGDQLLCLIPFFSEKRDMTRIAANILRIFNNAFYVWETSIRLTGSLGVTVYDGENEEQTADSLLEQALTAMHACQQDNDNAYQYYEETLEEPKHWNQQLGYHITTGLEKNEFFLEYQPIIDTTSGAPMLMEALVRWEHPELGRISPGEFIPLAEELGSIVALGDWVLREACENTVYWRNQGFEHLIVSVNVSVKQLLEGKGFVQTVEKVLRSTSLPASCLELEITETVLMVKEGNIKETLEQLYQLGVRLAIDDFGTGYSSLTHLNTFPVHTLKIDQTFIRDVPYHENNQAIVRALISLSQQLGLTAVAEGVETAEAAEALREQNCRGLQGYYFSRPLPEPDVLPYLQSFHE